MNQEQKRAAENLRDSELIKAHRNGDTRAFYHLMNHHQKHIFRYCFENLHDYDKAQDATQEVFIKFLEAITSQKFNKASTVGGWLQNTAFHDVTHILEKRKITTELVEDFPEPVMEESQNEEEIGTKRDEEKKFLRKLIGKLSRKDKKLFTLRIFKKMSFKLIGGIVDMTENTASSRYGKIKKEIKNSMTAFILARKKTDFP